MQLTYNFVVKKFEELKGFVQNCENAIDSTQNDYFNKKKEAENRWNSEASRMKIQFEADKKAMVRKAENMLEDALQISGEIAQIEQTLLIKDKYYKKTKIKKVNLVQDVMMGMTQKMIISKSLMTLEVILKEYQENIGNIFYRE